MARQGRSQAAKCRRWDAQDALGRSGLRRELTLCVVEPARRAVSRGEEDRIAFDLAQSNDPRLGGSLIPFRLRGRGYDASGQSTNVCRLFLYNDNALLGIVARPCVNEVRNPSARHNGRNVNKSALDRRWREFRIIGKYAGGYFRRVRRTGYHLRRLRELRRARSVLRRLLPLLFGFFESEFLGARPSLWWSISLANRAVAKSPANRPTAMTPAVRPSTVMRDTCTFGLLIAA